MDERAILALGSAVFAVSEYEAFCKRYQIDSIPRTGLTDNAGLKKAVADAVTARAAAGKSPYVAFIWFFDTSRYSPFGENMLSQTLALVSSVCLSLRQSGGGAGYDDVGTEWMASEGAYYCNTPTAITVSTANGALLLILSATRA
ncbi:hypothetical protein B0H19DRAFT_1086467, partial [Mycena capillaripes]